MTIQKLPQNVIRLIAAGEVIDSMVAVVRELIENSLDAQANKIVISLYPQLWQIQVADNGVGMNRDELSLCLQPHTTSKISCQDDLFKISTLGFRGEALHSISQLADITIASYNQDDIGWEIVYQEGKVIKETPKAIAKGTIINVSNLFVNLPLRRQGNPPISNQIKNITNLIGQLALCHPQITWQLFINNKLYWQISNSKTAKNILPQLIKKVKLSDLQEIELNLNLATKNQPNFLKLVLGLPDRLYHHSPEWVKVGVNNRVVKLPELEGKILDYFKRILPRDRFPILFLHLQVTTDQIDWNLHPAKAKIYLSNLNYWQEKIEIALNQALRISEIQLPENYHNKRVEKLLNVAEKKGVYHLDNEAKKISENDLNQKNIGLINLMAIAQIRNTYIIAEHKEGIWLIEQHIAHERVLYEKLKNDWQLIPLKKPIILNNLINKQVEQLQFLQIEIENFGHNLWAVRNLPEMLITREDCIEALIELSWGGNLDSAQVAIACRTAIKNGTSLTLTQMQTLIDQWKITLNPHTCPHGRPIYLSLEESALYRFFKRSWVLGKSHGIEKIGR